MLKTTGSRLPQQPYKCYNCQHRSQRNSYSTSLAPGSPPDSCSRSSAESFGSVSSTSSYPPPTWQSRIRGLARPCDPLPGVAVQPAGCVTLPGSRSSGRTFAFSCHGSNHYPTPHYSGLPTFLPHQDHPCPPCQLEDLKLQADMDVTRNAKLEFPNLKCEMLVKDGRVWEEWQSKPSLDKYLDEKRTEEREMWVHVTRKWTQDLRNARVLVAEEDGLGLFA